MKITQIQDFKPITIVIETEKEALQLWDLTNNSDSEVAVSLSNWFSTETTLKPTK